MTWAEKNAERIKVLEGTRVDLLNSEGDRIALAVLELAIAVREVGGQIAGERITLDMLHELAKRGEVSAE